MLNNGSADAGNTGEIETEAQKPVTKIINENDFDALCENKDYAGIAGYISKLRQQGTDYIQNLINDWDVYKEQFNVYREKPTDQDEWRANHFTPIMHGVEQTILPKVVEATAGLKVNAIAAVKGVQQNEQVMGQTRPTMTLAEKSAKAIEIIIEKQKKEMNWYEAFCEFWDDAIRADVAYLNLTWDYEVKKVYWYEHVPKYKTEIKKFLGIVPYPSKTPDGYDVVEKFEERIIQDNPKLKRVDPRNLLFTPGAKTLDGKGVWIIHTDYVPEQHIKENPIYKHPVYGVPNNLADVQAMQWQNNQDVISEKDGHTGGVINDAVKLEIVKINGWHVEIANEKTVIRLQRGLYKHGQHGYFSYSLRLEPGAVIGKGIGRIISSLQTMANDLLNLRFDNLLIAIMNMWKVRTGAILDWGNLQMKPGGFIEVGNMPDVESLNPPPIDFAAYKEMEQIDNMVYKGTGTSDYLGAPVGGNAMNKTATGAINIINEANKQSGFAIKRCIDKVVIPILQQVAELNEQYLNAMKNGKANPEIIQKLQDYLGDEGARFGIKAEEIDFTTDIKWDFDGEDKRLITEQELNSLQQFIVAVKNDPASTGYINWKELFKEVALKMKLDPDKFFIEANQLMQKQAQPLNAQPGQPIDGGAMAMLEKMAAGGGGGNAGPQPAAPGAPTMAAQPVAAANNPTAAPLKP